VIAAFANWSCSMITAIVRFRLPKGMTLDDAKTIYEKSVPNYRGAPGLVRKYYLFGQDQVGGGVYLWQSREAAENMYSPAWKKMITERYGAPPEVAYYETPVIVDNAQN
jgi:hypothetical protein